MLVCIAAVGTQSVFAASAHWSSDYEKAKKQAIAESKPILAMFTASWCGPCKRMKSTTLVNRSVKQLLQSHFVTVMIDTDRNPSLTRQFHITAMPTVLVIDPTTGKTERSRGYLGRNEFLAFLNANKKDLQLASATSHEDNAANPPQPESKGLLTPYCLVSVVESGKLIKGSSQYSIQREGLTAYFSSEENKERFQKNPQKYWPQNNGACPVMATLTNRPIQGEARWAVEYDNKLFFCHSREHALKFIESPSRYTSARVPQSRETGTVTR